MFLAPFVKKEAPCRSHISKGPIRSLMKNWSFQVESEECHEHLATLGGIQVLGAQLDWDFVYSWYTVDTLVLRCTYSIILVLCTINGSILARNVPQFAITWKNVCSVTCQVNCGIWMALKLETFKWSVLNWNMCGVHFLCVAMSCLGVSCLLV